MIRKTLFRTLVIGVKTLTVGESLNSVVKAARDSEPRE